MGDACTVGAAGGDGQDTIGSIRRQSGDGHPARRGRPAPGWRVRGAARRGALRKAGRWVVRCPSLRVSAYGWTGKPLSPVALCCFGSLLELTCGAGGAEDLDAGGLDAVGVFARECAPAFRVLVAGASRCRPSDRSDSIFAFNSVWVSGPSSSPTSNRFSTFQLITRNWSRPGFSRSSRPSTSTGRPCLSSSIEQSSHPGSSLREPAPTRPSDQERGSALRVLATAAVRVWTPSLANTFSSCRRTVPDEIQSVRAISAFVIPSATSRTTWCSRRVRTLSLPTAALMTEPRGGRAHDRPHHVPCRPTCRRPA